MKSVFILPTDKPSELHLWTDKNGSRIELCNLEYSHTRNTQFIYIVNEEQVKINDWYYNHKTNTVQRRTHSSSDESYEGFGKIVLTNDNSLIEDGVQEVSSVFLSFYAENPVESVALLYEPKNLFDFSQGWKYSIIFPQKGLERGITITKVSQLNEDGTETDITNKPELWHLNDSQKEIENKENWQFERSSGYAGYRNIETDEWIYQEDYFKLFSAEEKLYTKEDLELAHQQGAMFAYGRKEATRTDRLTHFEKWFNAIKK